VAIMMIIIVITMLMIIMIIIMKIEIMTIQNNNSNDNIEVIVVIICVGRRDREYKKVGNYCTKTMNIIEAGTALRKQCGRTQGSWHPLGGTGDRNANGYQK